MPRPGGYDAQDAAWSADMDTITSRYNWHVSQLQDKDGDEQERDLDVGAFIGAVSGIGHTDWRDVVGE